MTERSCSGGSKPEFVFFLIPQKQVSLCLCISLITVSLPISRFISKRVLLTIKSSRDIAICFLMVEIDLLCKYRCYDDNDGTPTKEALNGRANKDFYLFGRFNIQGALLSTSRSYESTIQFDSFHGAVDHNLEYPFLFLENNQCCLL